MTKNYFCFNQICSNPKNYEIWNWSKIHQIYLKAKICLGIWHLLENLISLLAIVRSVVLFPIAHPSLPPPSFTHDLPQFSSILPSIPLTDPPHSFIFLYASPSFHSHMLSPLPVVLSPRSKFSSFHFPSLLSFTKVS